MVVTQDVASLLRAVLILEIMKRLPIYFILFLSTLLLQGCSLKHKWQNKQKENLTHRKQEHLSHLLANEHLIVDTSLQYSHSQLLHYRLWRLSGNVNFHPNGSFQTDHAILESWHNATDSQETTSFQTTYQNQTLEHDAIKQEATDINKKSSYKEKRKFSTNLWWLLVVLIPLLLLWVFRGNRNS